jgi:hypothetical protein
MLTETSNEEEKVYSLIEQLHIKQQDQDFMQRTNVATILVLEMYRVLTGAFLILFVPQKCDEEICSISQNIYRDDIISQTALAFNSVTMVLFLFLYYIEVKRENKLINYLEVNVFKPRDNTSVENALLGLEENKKQIIWNYDNMYQKFGYSCSLFYILNAIISSIVIYSYYLDSKTITVYLTNILFMGFKVNDVYTIVNTDKNIFYSAYMKNRVQFNDVDPDKKLHIEPVEQGANI